MRPRAGAVLQYTDRSDDGSARPRSPQSITPATVSSSPTTTCLMWRSPCTTAVASGSGRSRASCSTRPTDVGARHRPSRSHSASCSSALGTRIRMSVLPNGSTGRSASTSVACSARRNAPSCPATRRAGRVAQAGDRRLASCDQLAAEERPREALRRAADEHGNGDAQRQPRRELRQHGDLALEARQRDRAAREAEHPAAVGEPDAVVPALPQQRQRAQLELRELAGDQRAGQLLTDLDLRAPLVHGVDDVGMRAFELAQSAVGAW